MTRDGLINIDAVDESEIVTFPTEAGIPAFHKVTKKSCMLKPALDLVSIRTATGNRIVASFDHEFVLAPEGEPDSHDPIWDVAEVTPAGLIDVGQRLYALDRFGAIIEDPIIDIGPVAADCQVCSLEHSGSFFPVVFAGGLGILSG